MPSGYRVLTRCKGTQEIIKALIEEDTRLAFGQNGAWKLFSLFRMGVDLGNLANIRDDYGFWVNQVDEWAAENKQRRRARRHVRSSGLIWRNSEFYQLQSDGSTEPVDDQHLRNPVYQHHSRTLSL